MGRVREDEVLADAAHDHICIVVRKVIEDRAGDRLGRRGVLADGSWADLKSA